ncbi:MAG: tRNA (5-methylaminomethyl-2-thiouridine)(34)-methyltransferase MnmD [Saprospiraceae bacterium]|jgi:tRNA U34 5-methylaminomethyl-2-thiouridine-forming methyltransferase MnmC|nr:tRNA (5-methylaminomethyl-2-thiouridine)(34)-methyltransferase MnmD [Saprospiraceae bacterium]
MSEQPKVFLSGDGSHSLISSTFDTSYHSKHGAITESTVVFIEAGLDYLANHGYRSIRVLEMGFGTGLNAILAFNWAKKHHTPIQYQTVEAYPISNKIASSLNYGKLCHEENIFQSLHLLDWNQNHSLSETFTFQKHLCKMEDIDLPSAFDVIFFDAFAPANQPELWTVNMLSNMIDCLEDGGVLVSFCAQGAFKRNLKTVGFKVEPLPGPPGKREMTRAIKIKNL